jgi:hypothetical protein
VRINQLGCSSCLKAARHVDRVAVAIALNFDAVGFVLEAGEPAVDMLQGEQVIDDGQMVWSSPCSISFAFYAAFATAAARAVARRVSKNRGATNSQMSQPSPITSMPPMTAWTPDAYSAYTLYAMPTTVIAIVRV